MDISYTPLLLYMDTLGAAFFQPLAKLVLSFEQTYIFYRLGLRMSWKDVLPPKIYLKCTNC